MFSDSDFMRYSRQLLLEEFGVDTQQKLFNSRVLIVGLGGLGSPAALYLAAAGVGTLLLADDDTVHISNLQRQILFHTHQSGQRKTEIARQHLLSLNPTLEVVTLDQSMNTDTLKQAIKLVDMVLDCSDNMPTRHAINAACLHHAIPLISASATGFSGQLLVLTPPFQHGCYRCLWPDEAEPTRNCRTAGVLGPVVGIMGTMQALEALKMLAGLASPLTGKLQLFDGRQQTWRTLNLERSALCPLCGGGLEHHH
ncbi:HesA/MoeB/ThiF family protein [Erwinia tracheiphila]|uniref:Molybdopterin-synthase adenylyltransferase n=1 Tax=Erwinia tracheiphila TaxID=65700 RepID=A0A0M2KIH9_9GAMM|nr:HesA/MoeB/ThiF family protein [Erwinia tracheiphila]EOS94520.1 sulfur carrier protein ThiS adenylyltransferase [Erwinia tracheiphila PSU-1]KKF36821.1 molybdopterin-synthase adenylyltransferase [Erwinia tracheiphila]UIA88161.1 HesA/MoeB/ThiF family protein [Erwinia tracheiphila]UIA96754.1 HesA/MoeB/ThiF family protein [Erwinia tracheiphila]